MRRLNILHVISICWKSWLSTGERVRLPCNLIVNLCLSIFSFTCQMHSHQRYRCRIHLNDDLTSSIIPPLVLSNSWFWIATSLLDAQSASVIARRLSTADIERPLEHHTVKTFTRTRAYELCGCIGRAVFVFERTLTALFDNRVKLHCAVFESDKCFFRYDFYWNKRNDAIRLLKRTLCTLFFWKLKILSPYAIPINLKKTH